MVSNLKFVWKPLGYGLLGFSMEISFGSLSRVLLETQPNPKFVGSWVEEP